MPEDLQVLELARAMSWRRCPACKAIVELAHGTSSRTRICRGNDFNYDFRLQSHHMCLQVRILSSVRSLDEQGL